MFTKQEYLTMFTKQEYLEEYKNNNKNANITKLLGYIEERLNHNSSLGCDIARFESFQLTPSLWKILTDDKRFKELCKCKGYELTLQKNEDGSWVDITSTKAKEDAEIWNQTFKNNDVNYFFNIIMGRIFTSGLAKNIKHPFYTIHKDCCSPIVWKLANSKTFLEKIVENGWDFDIGPESIPYIQIKG